MRTLLEAWNANTPHDLGVAAAIVLGVLVSLWILRYAIARAADALAARSTAPFHRVAADTVRATRLWLLAPVAVYIGASALRLPEAWSTWSTWRPPSR